jgi:hypothetical protein
VEGEEQFCVVVVGSGGKVRDNSVWWWLPQWEGKGQFFVVVVGSVWKVIDNYVWWWLAQCGR